MAGKSDKEGTAAVEAVITCGKTIAALRKRILSLNNSPLDSDASADEFVGVTDAIRIASQALQQELAKEKRLMAQLGIDNRTALKA